MKKQGFTLILFLVTSLFLLTQSVLAVNQFIFSASASDGYVETYSSSSSQPTLTTNKTFTIRIEFNDTLQSNLFVEKQSNFANWNGTESINSQGKVWTFSNVPPGNYFFKVLVGQLGCGGGESGVCANAVATLNVEVNPSITSITHLCDPSRAVLNWTAVPSADWYEVDRNDSANPLGYPSAWQITTNSYIDTTISPNTAYIYTVKPTKNSGLPADNSVSAFVATGTCTPLCGNSVINPPEQCDNGAQNGVCPATCSLSCTPNNCGAPEYCGDGIVQTPNDDGQNEQCDDGNTNNNDGCTNSCLNAVCGDSIIRTGVETCDDGNVVSGDGCSSTCQVEPKCVFTSAAWSTSTTVEGNVVSLNVQGTNCAGQSVSFGIWEDDSTSSDDPVNVNASNAVFSGNNAVTTWIAEYQDDPLAGDPEYYFIAQSTTNARVNAQSGLLTVTQIIPPPQCGNSVINGGEQCDGGTGCTASCQCSAGYQPTSPLSVNCQAVPPPPSCGNGICEPSLGETSASCLQDCPTTPQCQLTSSAWSRTQATERQTVNLNVQGNNCGGQTVSFVVWEDDTTSTDDAVNVNPVSVAFSGNTATGSWAAEWQGDGLLGDDPEYYFLASVSGAGNSPLSSGTLDNQLLHVNQSTVIFQCSDIATCGNYVNQNDCNNDEILCNVADNSVPSGVDCNDPNIVCVCAWNVTTNDCDANVNGPAGKCVYTQQTTDDCSDGFLTFSWTANWTWFSGKTLADDPEGLSLQCVSGSRRAECPAQIALPFFSFYNLIVAVIVIGLVYWVLVMRKSGKRKNRR